MGQHPNGDDIERDAIARELGPQWSYLPPDDTSRPYNHLGLIQDNEGHAIQLSAGTKGQWHVSGFFPSLPNSGAVYAPYAYGVTPQDHGYQTINVSRLKAHKLIARDIHRRFIPGYFTAFDRCKAVRDQTLGEVHARNTLLRETARRFGKSWEPRNGDRRGDDNLTLYLDGKPGSVSINTRTGEDITVSFRNVTPEQLSTLLDVVQPASVTAAMRRSEEGTLSAA